MAHTSKTTADHDEIRKWIEERGGRPSVVGDTYQKSDGGGVLRIDFGEEDDRLEEISWEEFFRIFDENELRFLYQEELESGQISRFFKFVRK